MARVPLLPVAQVTSSTTHQNTPSNTGFGEQISDLVRGDGEDRPTLPFQLPDRLDITTYSLGAAFAYELDFWGRARNDLRAAGMEYLASEADYRIARIGVVAETIGAYFEVVDLRDRLALAQKTVEVVGERAELALGRYERGLATSFELNQLRQDLLNTEAGLPQLATQLERAESRLAGLLGGYRDKLASILVTTTAPDPLPEPLSAGLPADLLMQRPDVASAWLRLEAARFAIGARKAERLPSLSLAGTIGLQSGGAPGLFNVDQWFRNLVANLTAPIFQSGLLKNSVALAQARFGRAAAAYGRVVVMAVNEVEASLGAHDNALRRHALLESHVDEATRFVELQSSRYRSGIGGYADYLVALRSLMTVEAALSGARRELALSRLSVNRALGGDWSPLPDSLPDLRMVPAAASQVGAEDTRRESR